MGNETNAIWLGVHGWRRRRQDRVRGGWWLCLRLDLIVIVIVTAAQDVG